VGQAGQGGRGQGDDRLGVGDLAEHGPLKQQAVAGHADEAGRDLVGNGRGDPAGGPLPADQGQQGVADQVGAALPARLERRVGASPAALLDDQGGPVGVLGGQAGQDVGERPGRPAGGLALGVALQNGQEQVQLGLAAVACLADQLAHRAAPWYAVLGDDGVVEHLAFMARIYDYDPAPALERVTCPLLAIWGQRDIYVPVAASAERFAAALGRAGNGSFRLEVVPDADHGLRLPATGDDERGPRIPDLMDMIVTWLRRALPPRAGRG